MNVFVFDPHRESSQVWQELAASHSLRVHIFQNFERLAGLAHEAHILVVDQAVVLHSFSSTIATLCRQHPRVLVVASGNGLGVDTTVDLMSEGAAMVFCKPLQRARLAECFPVLLRRAERLAELTREHQVLHGLFSKLTSREKDVLNYILIGTSNKDTAQLLNVSVRTIESRRAKVYRKLESNSVAELVRKIDRLEALGKELGVQPQFQPLPALVPQPGQPNNNQAPAHVSSHGPGQRPHQQTSTSASGVPLPHNGRTPLNSQHDYPPATRIPSLAGN